MDKQQYQDIDIDTCFMTTLRGVAHTQQEVNRLLQVAVKDLLVKVE